MAEIDGAEETSSENTELIENSDDGDLTQMKAKFNKLLANFEKEEIIKPINGANTDLSS